MKQILLFLRYQFKRIDWILLAIAAALSVIGVVLIASATATFGTHKLVIVQIGALALGFLGAAVILLLEHGNIARFSLWIYILCVLLLIATLLLGYDSHGNRNWIAVGPINIQPSELVKLGFIITFSYHLNKVRESINHPRTLLLLLAHFGVIAALVFLEGDLGSTLIFVSIFFSMMLAAGLHWGYFLGAFAAIGGASPFIFDKLNDYQQKRILAVYDPTLDPMGIGYQVNQSKIAIGSGQLAGEGYLNGVQTQYSILPEKQTDFIFAVCGEEFGFLGCLVIILLEAALVLRLIYIARHAADHLGTFICAGLAGMFFFQTALNIGMCIGLLPVVGVTLPFMSYGGSSALTVALSTGLAMSVNAARPKEGFFNKNPL